MAQPILVEVQDFPKNEIEFHERFSDEEKCREYWSSVRWPSGFVCPHCGFKGGWRRANRDEWICANHPCRRETSLRAGSVLHNSKKPIKHWLMAMLHMTINKQGISALRLQRLLGFGSYETALRWLRELRRVMAATDASEKLGPELEVDEMLLGGMEEGSKGPYVGKEIVMGAVERKGNGCGRARLKIVPSRDGDCLCGFVQDVVEPGSIVLTDAYRPYFKLAEMGFIHDPRTTSNGRGGTSNQLRLEDGRKKSSIHLGQIFKVFSLVERVIASAYQGSFSDRHLQGYLDEYCFRFNRRLAANPLQILHSLVNRAASARCMPLWKSRGREAPDKPTKKANTEWQRMGQVLAGCSYGG